MLDDAITSHLFKQNRELQEMKANLESISLNFELLSRRVDGIIAVLRKTEEWATEVNRIVTALAENENSASAYSELLKTALMSAPFPQGYKPQ